MVVLSLWGVACGRRVELPDSGRPMDRAELEWSTLLTSVAQLDGTVDMDALAAQRVMLETYLQSLAARGPDTDYWKESEEDRRMAYVANAHNAVLLEGALMEGGFEAGCAQHHWWDRGTCPALFDDLLFHVDSDWTSPRELEEQGLLARYQEPLALMMLFQGPRTSGRLVGPPLRWWPARGLQPLLEESLSQWLELPEVLRATATGWEIHPWLFDHSTDVLHGSGSPSLCDWLVPYAPLDASLWLDHHRGTACTLGRLESVRAQ